MALQDVFQRILHSVCLRLGCISSSMGQKTHDARHSISQIGKGVHLGQAVLSGNNLIEDNCYLQGEIRVGYGSTLGRGCILRGGTLSIGRYSQLGPNVSLYASDHALTHLTTYNNKRLFNGELKLLMERKKINIEHDVWVGANAVVLRDVNIGTGAVIGANSLVNQDIPRFAIAVGNPARIVGQRFDDEIIELILRLAWWEKNSNELEKMKSLFWVDLVKERERGIEIIKQLIT